MTVGDLSVGDKFKFDLSHPYNGDIVGMKDITQVFTVEKQDQHGSTYTCEEAGAAKQNYWFPQRPVIKEEKKLTLGDLAPGDKSIFVEFPRKGVFVATEKKTYDGTMSDVETEDGGSIGGWYLRREVKKVTVSDSKKGDPRFHARLKEIGDLHDKKQADYGTGEDPLANLRSGEEIGIDPWVNAFSRLNDKIVRIKSFIKNGNVKNESIRDSFRDIAVYALLIDILFEEQYPGVK